MSKDNKKMVVASKVKDNATATVVTAPVTPESKILNELRRDIAQLNDIDKAKVLVDFEDVTIKIDNLDVKMERAAALQAIIDNDALLSKAWQEEKERRVYIAKFNKFFDSLSDKKNAVMISVLLSYTKTPKYWRETFMEVMEARFPENFTNSTSTAQQGGICGDTLYALLIQGLLPVDTFSESDLQFIIDNYFRPRTEKKAATKKSGIVVC